MVARSDISYNGHIYFSDDLTGIIARGERQRAFHYIAYKLRAKENLDAYPGYVTRSYKEALAFGYTDGDVPTDKEIEDFEKVYLENKEETDTIDNKWGRKLKKEVPGYKPFKEIVREVKSGKIVNRLPALPEENLTDRSRTGISNEQISLMEDRLLAHALPQPTGVSSLELVIRNFGDHWLNPRRKHEVDPYRCIKLRFGR